MVRSRSGQEAVQDWPDESYDGVVRAVPMKCPTVGCGEQGAGLVYADGTLEIVCSGCGRRKGGRSLKRIRRPRRGRTQPPSWATAI